MAQLEELHDVAAARDAEARVAAGASEYLPIAMAERLWAGEHPIRVWRDRRGLTGQQLAAASGVPQSYISEIERRKKPGSVEAFAKLARALGVAIDDLVTA